MTHISGKIFHSLHRIFDHYSDVDSLVDYLITELVNGFEVCRILRKETNIPILMLTFMAENPKTITRATRLIWVAHNLERSADRVTNICERVVYMVTGKIEELGVSKY